MSLFNLMKIVEVDKRIIKYCLDNIISQQPLLMIKLNRKILNVLYTYMPHLHIPYSNKRVNVMRNTCTNVHFLCATRIPLMYFR